MTTEDRGNCAALIIAIGAALCLLALAMTQHKPCYVPDEQRVGSMKISELCGMNIERTAVNEE